MKKILIAAICSGIVIFAPANNTEAADKSVVTEIQGATAQMEELGWTHIRRKIFGGKRKDKHSHDDTDYNNYPPPPPPRGPGHRPPPPPHHYR